MTEASWTTGSAALLNPSPSAVMAGDGCRLSHGSGHGMVRGALRVLVVDDDLPICDLLALAFADEGWDVQICTRSQKALDLL
jgi:hypothetical protein